MTAKSLRLVRSETPEQKNLAKQIILSHHSYVKSPHTAGRRIDYLIMNGDEAVGCIGVSSIPFPISSPVLDYFEKTMGSRILKPIFNNIGNNWKFTLTDKAPANSGSRVLGIFVKFVTRDWKEKYGDDLKWILTFVGGGHTGTIYKATGWILLGKTKGMQIVYPKGEHGAKVSKGAGGIGLGERMRIAKFVPGEKKLIFLKDLRKKGEGEATVLQGSIPADQVGDGGRTDPVAPLTKSYTMVIKNGKFRRVMK